MNFGRIKKMYSYIQYFPITHTYGRMKIVEEVDVYDEFWEYCRLDNDCISFVIEDDWRICDLDEYTKRIINIK